MTLQQGTSKHTQRDLKKLMKKARNFKSARIIVRNLPFKSSENEIKDIFSKYGDVKEVKLLKKDNRSIGCGFVQFDNKLSASKAIAKLGGSKLDGRPIILDWAIPKNVYEKSKIKKETPDPDVKVKEEPVDNDLNGDLEASSPIKVESCDSDESSDEDSESSCSESTDTSSDECDATNSTKTVKSEKEHAISMKARPDSGILQGKTLFIKDIPFSIESVELQEYFTKYGPLEYAVICKDSLTGHSKGCGFIKFVEKQHADDCLGDADSLRIKGEKLVVRLALQRNELGNLKPKKMPKDGRNLYLVKEGAILAGTQAAENVSEGDMNKRLQLELNKSRLLKNLHMFVSPTRLIVHNLPPSMTDRGLWHIFKKHSPKDSVIKEAKVMKDLKAIGLNGVTKSKEYGFVSFTKHLDALNALRAVNNNPDIFSDQKRPIVSFSIESKLALKLKEKRLAKSQTIKNESTAQDQSKVNTPKADPPEVSLPDTPNKFAGAPAKFGSSKLRTKKELKRQAMLHRSSLKNKNKIKRKYGKVLSRKEKRSMKLKNNEPPK